MLGVLLQESFAASYTLLIDFFKVFITSLKDKIREGEIKMI